MSKRKKLIVYTDGSYTEGKGGWAFHISSSKKGTNWTLGYGSYASKGSAQTEINACIEALNYLPYIDDEKYNDIEVIEIRSDFIDLIKIINNYNKVKLENILKAGSYSNYVNELLELIKVIRMLPVELQAVKVNKKDNGLLMVHRKAKYSLQELPNDNEHFYLETSENEEKQFLKKKSIIFNELKEIMESGKQKWFDYINAEITNLPVDRIFIEENIHLESQKIRFGGNLKQFKVNGTIDQPIAVRKNGDKYILIAGMSRLCAAKLLGFDTIPAVVQDISHTEFLLKYVI